MEKIPNIDFNADITHASSYRSTWKGKKNLLFYMLVYRSFFIVNNTR